MIPVPHLISGEFTVSLSSCDPQAQLTEIVEQVGKPTNEISCEDLIQRHQCAEHAALLDANPIDEVWGP